MASGKPGHPLWRITKVIIGLAFLGLGVVGLFLPVLQGILFIFIGLAILATESRRVHRFLERLKQLHPGPWERAEAMKRWLSSWVKAKPDGKSAKKASCEEGSGGETS